MPAPAFCGEETFSECDDPAVQLNVCGAVYVVPSTITCRPLGELPTVTEIVAPTNVAVTVCGAVIVTDVGFPVSPPDHELNVNPLFARAVRLTMAPLDSQHPLEHEGVIVPLPEGVTAVVN